VKWRAENGTALRAKRREAAVVYAAAFVIVVTDVLLLVEKENFRAPVGAMFAGLPFVLLAAWGVWAGVRILPLVLAVTNTVRASVFLGDYFLADRHTLPRWLSFGMSPGIGGLGNGVHLFNGLLLAIAVLFRLRAGLDLPPGPFHGRSRDNSKTV